MLLLAGGVAIPKGAAGRGEDGAQAGGRRGQGQRENPQPIKEGIQKQKRIGGACPAHEPINNEEVTGMLEIK